MEGNVNRGKRRFLLGATTAVGTFGVIASAVPFAMSFWMRELSRGACVAVGWRPLSDLSEALDRCDADLLVSTSANLVPFAQSLELQGAAER